MPFKVLFCLMFLGLLLSGQAGAPVPAVGEELQVGIYGLGANGNFAEDVQTVRREGFKVAVVAADRSQLDVLRKAGMKGLAALWLTPDATRDDAAWRAFLARLRAKVGNLKGHPALLAWYLADEPDGQGIPVEKLQAARAVLKSLDPATPVFGVLDSPKQWQKYLSCFDMVAVDPYMRKKLLGGYESPEVVTAWLRRLKEDLEARQLTDRVWVVLGAFDTRPKGGKKASNYRKPTAQEFRSMVEMARSEGVDGILVYTFGFAESNRYLAWKLPQDDPALWAEVRTLPAKVKK